MSIRLLGSVSGYSELEAPSVAGDQTFTLPSAGGTLVTTDGTQTLTNKTIQGGAITSGTAQSATGTAVDFTGIPSWVKRVTVMFDGVSTNGTSPPIIQLGDSGGIVATGYNGSNAAQAGTASNALTSTTDFRIGYNASNWAATRLVSGVFIVGNVSGNTWATSGNFGTNTNFFYWTAGSVTLSNSLTQVRITTAGGTDTFDAGTINIMYE